VIVTGLQCSAEPADQIEFVFRHGEPVTSAYPNTVSEKKSGIAKNRVASMQIFVLLRICRSIFPLLRGGGASIVALSTTPQHRQPPD